MWHVVCSMLSELKAAHVVPDNECRPNLDSYLAIIQTTLRAGAYTLLPGGPRRLAVIGVARSVACLCVVAIRRSMWRRSAAACHSGSRRMGVPRHLSGSHGMMRARHVASTMYVYTYIHTYVHTYIQTYIHTYRQRTK